MPDDFDLTDFSQDAFGSPDDLTPQAQAEKPELSGAALDAHLNRLALDEARAAFGGSPNDDAEGA